MPADSPVALIVSCIASPVTGKTLCGANPADQPGVFAGLDVAYRSILIGNGPAICPTCVRTAALAMEIHSLRPEMKDGE